MAQQNYELAEHDYMNGMKYKDIAEKYGVTINTVKSWKTRYDWSKDKTKGVHTKEKVCTQKKSAQSTSKVPEVNNALTEPLNDNQRLFCEVYANNRNATQAYIRAYGVSWEVANVNGPRLLVDARVRGYVDELLRIKRESIFLEGDDLIERQMRIAFADITDFVEFGIQYQPVIAGGQILYSKEVDPNTGHPIPVMQQVNAIRFKNSDEVDGGLICEISTSKQGAKIKLEDRQKALDWLADFFLMNPNDIHKHEFDQKRLEQEERKLAIAEAAAKSNGEDGTNLADLIRQAYEKRVESK